MSHEKKKINNTHNNKKHTLCRFHLIQAQIKLVHMRLLETLANQYDQKNKTKNKEVLPSYRYAQCLTKKRCMSLSFCVSVSFTIDFLHSIESEENGCKNVVQKF